VVHWLTLDELSSYLKTPKSSLYKLCRKGVISGHKLGKKLLFDREEIDLQIKLRKRKSPGKEVAREARRKQAS
jgi:excisionase family DNA binding protein